MRKVIPPRMVGPYMGGQRDVIAGYVHRLRDVPLRGPGDAFHALGLGYDGSEFRPDMAELYFLCWQAREIDGYVPVSADRRGSGSYGGAPAGPAWSGEPVEFYLEPIQIPVGTALCRLNEAGEETVARYDGLAWRRPGEGGVRHALPADGVLPRRALSGWGRPLGPRCDAVRRRPAPRGPWLLPQRRALA